MIHNTKVSIIAAMDEKRGIGKDNNLLFKISEDFKRMKSLTDGHALIMGRKTFESLGRLLPNRTHIVVTRNAHSLDKLHYKPEFVAASVGEGIEIALRQAQAENKEIFIFGGGQIYAEALKSNLVDRMYLTIVKGDYKADTFFPEYSGFKIVNKEEVESDGYYLTFLDLEK